MSERDEWVDLRVLVVNTHVGLLLLTGVRWLLGIRRWHVVLLCECSSPVARMKLRAVFAPTKWKLVGVKPPSTGRGSSGTIVATRRSRLTYVSSSNPLVTAQRFINGTRDKWHPERRLTRGTYRDHVSKQELDIVAMHLWHILGGPADVIREHDRQAQLYGLTARDSHKQLRIALMGGDVNESAHRGVVRDAMRAANMRTLSWKHIDAVFVSDAIDVRCVDVDEFDLSRFRGGESQHKAIGLTLQLRKLSSSITDD